MKYQSFASGRGFDPNKTFDETQRVLNQAQTHIEGLRALNQADEQQSAALINNIRSQRQRDKEDDNENHRLTMMSLAAAERARQRRDQVNRETARKNENARAKQEERNLNNIINFAKTAGQVVGEAREDLIKKYEEEGEQQFAESLSNLSNDFQKAEETELGVQGKVHELEGSFAGKQVESSLLKAQGQNRSLIERGLVGDSTYHVAIQRGALRKATESWKNGGQELYLAQNKDKTVTITRNGENVEITYGQIATLNDGVEYLQAIRQTQQEYIGGILGRKGNPELAAKAFTQLNSYNLSQVKNIERKKNQGILLQQIDSIKDNFFESVSGSKGASALKSMAQLSGFDKITNSGSRQILVEQFKLLPNSERQEFLGEFGELSWTHQPGVKIGRLGQDGLPVDPTFRELQLTHQRQLSVQSENYNKQQEQIGIRVGDDAFKVAYDTGSPDGTKRATETEQNTALRRVLDLYSDKKLSWEAYKAATRTIRSRFDSFEDLNRVNERIKEATDNYALTEKFIEEELKSGTISEKKAEELRNIVASYAEKTPGIQYGWSVEDKFKQSLSFLSAIGSYYDPVKQKNVIDSSIYYAASEAASDYAALVDQYSQTMTLKQAQLKAWTEIQSELDKYDQEGSRYMMTHHGTRDVKNRPFMNRFSVGEHIHSLQVPSRDIESSDELGAAIKKNPEILRATEFEVFDHVLESMATQARMGKEITMTPHMKDTQVASGLDRDEFVKRLFSGREEYKDIKITEGSFAKARKAIEKENPELLKYFDNLTIPNSNVIRNNQSVNILAPAQGHGQNLFNGHAINTQKLGLANHRKVAALAYHRKYAGGPLEIFYKEIQSDLDEYETMDFPPPEYMLVQETLVAFNASSSTSPLGQSSTVARIRGRAQAANGGYNPKTIPERSRQYIPTIQQYAQEFNVPMPIAIALFQKESAFDSNATSESDARGLGQVLDPTARDLGITDSYNPEQNIRGSLMYLAQIYSGKHTNKPKNWKQALEMYNAGPNHGDGVYPRNNFENRNYARQVDSDNAGVLDLAESYGWQGE